MYFESTVARLAFLVVGALIVCLAALLLGADQNIAAGIGIASGTLLGEIASRVSDRICRGHYAKLSEETRQLANRIECAYRRGFLL